MERSTSRSMPRSVAGSDSSSVGFQIPGAIGRARQAPGRRSGTAGWAHPLAGQIVTRGWRWHSSRMESAGTLPVRSVAAISRTWCERLVGNSGRLPHVLSAVIRTLLSRRCLRGGKGAEDRADVLGDVLALLGAVDQHRLEHVDRFRIDLVQLLDHRSLVAGGVRIGHEGICLVGEGVDVDSPAEQAGHDAPPFVVCKRVTPAPYFLYY